MAEEQTLPRLPGNPPAAQLVTANMRKRVRALGSAPLPPLATTSSDPAVFSSDDDPSLDNYGAGGRRKKRYVGSWYEQHPAASSDSGLEETLSQALPKTKRTFERHFDSGVWMGSDGDGAADLDDGVEGVKGMGVSVAKSMATVIRPPVPARKLVSPEEATAREKIRFCIDEGQECIDLS
jgi:hypothetical protein